jgi:serine/threonine protein kinase
VQVRTLGEGAFAKVVHCRLKREGQADLDVAVKLLKPALFSSDLDVSDFVKEGIILKRLRHP